MKMVTLRSGKAVPYLGKNVPKRKTVKKTKKNNLPEKSNDSKLPEKPDKSTKQNVQMKPSQKEIPESVQATASAPNQTTVAATATGTVQEEHTIETTESAVFTTPQPVLVFDNPDPLPVDDSNEVPPCNASTSHETELALSLNDISGMTNQSKHSVLDESSDDSAETMIDDSFEITDLDYDQLEHDSARNDESFQMQEPAVRICLPVRETTSSDNKENIPPAENSTENNDDDKEKRKPLTDLCGVTNISWF